MGLKGEHPVVTPTLASDIDTASPRTTTPPRHQRWRWTAASQLLGILWLGPMCALLALNFRGYVAGAGAGCMGFCNFDFSAPAVLNAPTLLDLDGRNRNILGALQLAAKCLEVWFVVIVGSLVYDLSIRLATTRDGLPLRYLFTHVEFADPRTIFSPSLWMSSKPRGGEGAHGKLALYGFVGLTVILCILVNLMGPATAVLILPTLGQREASEATAQNVRFFDQVRSAGPPRNTGVLSYTCSASDLEAGKYSCASPDLIESIAVQQRLAQGLGELWRQEDFYFMPNVSDDGISWIHNRQLLLALDGDVFSFSFARDESTFGEYQSRFESVRPFLGDSEAKNISEGQYRLYRESLQTVLGRKGPSLGFGSHCNRSLAVVQVSEDREVHCYSIPTRQTRANGSVSPTFMVLDGFIANRTSDDAGTKITKCIRVGSGWGAAAPLHAQFHVAGTDESSLYTADIYSADRAVYLTPEQSRCAQADNSTQTCDWQQIFAADIPSEIRNTSVNILVTEYTAEGQNPIMCETLAFLSFPMYQVEFGLYPSLSSLIVKMQGIERDLDTPPVRVHPGWVLAAWSVDSNGTLDSSSSQAAFVLEEALRNTAPDDSDSFGHTDLGEMHNNALGQALSLVDYTTAPPAPDGSGPDSAHPLEEISQQVRVWQYSFGSRTSILGGVVAVAGCLVVVVRTCVGLWVRARGLGPTTLVATALKQPEVEALGGLSDRKLGENRFLFEDDGTGDGVRYAFPEVGGEGRQV